MSEIKTQYLKKNPFGNKINFFKIFHRFSPDNSFFAFGFGGIQIWDIKKKEHIFTLSRAFDDLTGILFLKNAKQLISCDSKSCLGWTLPDDGDLKLWDIQTGKLLSILENGRICTYVTLSSDEKYAIAFSNEGDQFDPVLGVFYGKQELKVWDLKNRAEIAMFERGRVREDIFNINTQRSSDGKYVIQHFSNMLIFKELFSMNEIARFENKTNQHKYSPDRKRVISASGNKIVISFNPSAAKCSNIHKFKLS